MCSQNVYYPFLIAILLFIEQNGDKWRDLCSMDKKKVITAYHRGFITIQECGQILGLEQVQLNRLLHDSIDDHSSSELKIQPINS